MVDKIVIFGVLKSVADYKVKKANETIAQASRADAVISRCRDDIRNLELFVENSRQDFEDRKETQQEIEECRFAIERANYAKKMEASARQDLKYADGFYNIYREVLKHDLLRRKYACEFDIGTLDNRMDAVSINATTPEFGQDVNNIYSAELDYIKEKLKAKEKQLADINAKLAAINIKTNHTR